MKQVTSSQMVLAALVNQRTVNGPGVCYSGPVNGDRRVDISDFGFFSLAYLTPANYNAVLDYNLDGRIDITDFGQFSVRYFTTLP